MERLNDTTILRIGSSFVLSAANVRVCVCVLHTVCGFSVVNKLSLKKTGNRSESQKRKKNAETYLKMDESTIGVVFPACFSHL